MDQAFLPKHYEGAPRSIRPRGLQAVGAVGARLVGLGPLPSGRPRGVRASSGSSGSSVRRPVRDDFFVLGASVEHG